MRKVFFYILLSLSVNIFAKELVDISDKELEKQWITVRKTPESSLQLMISFLAQSETGARLIEMAHEKAAKIGKSLESSVFPGQGSITDTTLIRKFTAGNPENVRYEVRSKVYINKSLSFYDATLDLAHELTHFVYRTGFNPYSKNFHLKQFIRTTVEGKGGEVDAFLMECKVLAELFPRKLRSNNNCYAIYDSSEQKFTRELAVKRFYQVGSFYSLFGAHLEKHNFSKDDFPHANDDSPAFISSAYGLPYPIASLHEFESILTKVCSNDHKRLSYLKNKMAANLADDDSALPETQVTYLQLLQDFQRRCEGKFSRIDNK